MLRCWDGAGLGGFRGESPVSSLPSAVIPARSASPRGFGTWSWGRAERVPPLQPRHRDKGRSRDPQGAGAGWGGSPGKRSAAPGGDRSVLRGGREEDCKHPAGLQRLSSVLNFSSPARQGFVSQAVSAICGRTQRPLPAPAGQEGDPSASPTPQPAEGPALSENPRAMQGCCLGSLKAFFPLLLPLWASISTWAALMPK